MLTRSRPLIPVLFPAAAVASFALRSASCSASFLSIRVCFHFANVSGVTGVKFGPNLWRCIRRHRRRTHTYPHISTQRKEKKKGDAGVSMR